MFTGFSFQPDEQVKPGKHVDSAVEDFRTGVRFPPPPPISKFELRFEKFEVFPNLILGLFTKDGALHMEAISFFQGSRVLLSHVERESGEMRGNRDLLIFSCILFEKSGLK